MASPVLVALAVTGAAYIVSGLGLIVHARARLTGVFLSVSGGCLLGAAWAESTGNRDASLLTGAVAAQAGAVALAAYPQPGWHRPVDFVGLTLVGAAPVLLLVSAWGSAAPTSWAGNVVTTGIVLVVLFLLTWWRLEHPATYDRWALTWMALSTGAALIVAGVVAFAAVGTAGTTVAVASFVPIGPALYLGVNRPELVDVRGLVVRFVVLAATVLTYVALFMTVAALAQIVTGGEPSLGTLALLAALCAVGFSPLQGALRGVVEELLFGRLPDPLGTVSQVAGHLGEDPTVALATIRDALSLPYASVLVDGEELATTGTPVARTRSLPLDLGDDSVAELRVGLRVGELDLTRSEEHVLGLVTPLLAQTLRLRALAADLQASREGTVAALEEERRRLRRDLHDGLGPRLSGIAFTSDAARNTLRSDPATADTLLAGLRAETVAAINEIRELVYGMRPPALDELGLLNAVRQQAAGLRVPDGRPFRVSLEGGELPRCPRPSRWRRTASWSRRSPMPPGTAAPTPGRPGCASTTGRSCSRFGTAGARRTAGAPGWASPRCGSGRPSSVAS